MWLSGCMLATVRLSVFVKTVFLEKGVFDPCPDRCFGRKVAKMTMSHSTYKQKSGVLLLRPTNENNEHGVRHSRKTTIFCQTHCFLTTPNDSARCNTLVVESDSC